MGNAAKKLKKLVSAGDDDFLVKPLGTAEDLWHNKRPLMVIIAPRQGRIRQTPRSRQVY